MMSVSDTSDDLKAQVSRLQKESEELRRAYQSLAISYTKLAELGSRPPIMVPSHTGKSLSELRFKGGA